jgi:hypothetical protein
VPIPSFDSPASPPAPAVLPNAQIRPAAGTAVIIPSTSSSQDKAEISPFQQPPSKAVVKLDSGNLTIHAKNSSLAQILRDLSSSSGMKVDGFSRDERFFGSFGPDDPHAVLNSLLDGSGYNVIMLGDSDKGMPRVLALSARSKPGQPDVAPESQQPAMAEDEDEQMTDEPADAPPTDNPILAPVPAAAAPIPDTTQSQPAPASDDSPQVRTPQQILEDLQRLHPEQTPPPTQPNPPSQ